MNPEIPAHPPSAEREHDAFSEHPHDEGFNGSWLDIILWPLLLIAILGILAYLFFAR